jgi:hypothetical protein
MNRPSSHVVTSSSPEHVTKSRPEASTIGGIALGVVEVVPPIETLFSTVYAESS